MSDETNRGTFLVNRVSGGRTKQFYTREQDETIVKMTKAGASVPEIAKIVGHSAPSVTYRLGKLSIMKSFSEYDYDNHRLKVSAEEIKTRKAASLAQANDKTASTKTSD